MREFTTPMMQQYMDIRAKYPTCMLFFRLGDFYELFLDDAIEGAKILGITLTRRPRGKDGDIPMAGVPFHSANIYINKLLKAGKKIAICEQISEPDTKGLVERKVIRIITPGTVVDDNSLEHKKNNYIVSLSFSANTIGLAAIDVLTGSFSVTQITRDQYEAEEIGTEIMRFLPSECLMSVKDYNNPQILKIVSQYHQAAVNFYPDWESVTKNAETFLLKHFAIPTVTILGMNGMKEAIAASAALISYINSTQQHVVTHIQLPTVYSAHDCVILDPATIVNLELFSTLQERKTDGSLFSVLDHTKTALGGRLLQLFLHHPLRKKEMIELRQSAVKELYLNRELREYFQENLERIFDIERLSSRIALGLGVPASMLNVKQSLEIFLALQPKLKESESTLLQKIGEINSRQIQKIVTKIADTLVEIQSDESSVGSIKNGVDLELDALQAIADGGKKWMQEFEVSERKRSGITTLKCRYNQVFGFYIEISQAQTKSVPENYIRKQTLVNAERFVTKELKEQEEKILHAQTEITRIEKRIFSELTANFLEALDAIKQAAQGLAQLDVFCSLAQLAQEERYACPTITESGDISITAGKHPVLYAKFHEQCVPNDVVIKDGEEQLLLITGPNMAGKSVYMRQVALLVLLAHIGSFIPAHSASIALVDRIFVRSGAADNISRGLSTFMVEMVEAAHILHQTTSKSLVIMDEIGRGTSTYDGISIAWAIAEFLVTEDNKQPKVLFATHYHELQALEKEYPKKVKNYQVCVEEADGKPVFLYTVKEGAASHSFGIAVAQLAGLPSAVLEKAESLLKILEAKDQHAKKNK